MLSSEQLAYIAGIVDGEGCISLFHTTNQHRPVRNRNSRSVGNSHPGRSRQTILRVSVGMTDKTIPEWLYATFGGVLQYRQRAKSSWKDRWDWNLSSQMAAAFLKQILPYLKIKHGQAELGIVFQEMRRPHLSITDIQRQIDDTLVEACHKLNARGKVA